MAKYQTNNQRQYRYQMIAKAEGEQCICCWAEGKVRRSPPTVKLEIDHADGDRSNWSWSNLHLVCHQHNCKLRELPANKHISLLITYSDQVERERKGELAHLEVRP